MPMITASTGASFRFGASRAELPWQNSTNSPTPAPTLSTATMVFMPGRNFVGSLSSTSCGRSSNNFRPLMEASFFVATTDPSTFAKNIDLAVTLSEVSSRFAFHRSTLHAPRSDVLLRYRFLRQHSFDLGMRPRDNVNTGQFAFDG